MTDLRPHLAQGTPVRLVEHPCPADDPQLLPCLCEMPLGTIGVIRKSTVPHNWFQVHGTDCQHLYIVDFDGYVPHLCCELQIEPVD